MKPKRVAVLATIALSLSAAHAADKWWDGGAADIGSAGNAASAGTTGTWNLTTLNWDQGNGLNHVAWNSASDSAIFGGGGATVTLVSP